MMKRISRYCAFLLAVLLLLSLTACTGDPIPISSNGNIDISDALSFVTGGSFPSVSVSVRNGKVDMKASRQELEEARQRLSSAADAGLAGVWYAEVDINRAVFSNYASIEGLVFPDTPLTLPAVLTLTESGSFSVCFDRASLDELRPALEGTALSAAREYLNTGAGAAGKIVGKALDDQILSQVLGYVEDTAMMIFSSGICGSYSVDGNSICFNGEYVCSFEAGDTLHFSGDPGGIMSFLTAGEVEFTR